MDSLRGLVLLKYYFWRSLILLFSFLQNKFLDEDFNFKYVKYFTVALCSSSKSNFAFYWTMHYIIKTGSSVDI